ncbi:MMPL family transporter [Candidatus Bipolaricaulota bacterium]|nr:MMPL family transporter [Candidatus Bipolaricaulota bacterium]
MDISQKLTQLLESLSASITNFPKATIIVVLLVTLFFGFWIPGLEIDNSVDDMLPSSHPAKELYDEVTETFGGTDTIIVAYRNDDIFSVETLSRIDELTEEFNQVEGVDDVRSIANAKKLEGSGGSLKVSDLVPESGVDPERISEIEEYVKNTQTLRGTVLSSDGKYAGFLVELSEDASDSTVNSDLKEIIGEEENPGNFYVAGGPAVNAEMTSSMKNDLVTLVPIAVGVLALVLCLTLRTTGGVYIPLSVVVLSTIWTLGLMALTGTEMSMISTTLPVMLIAIGVADAIHILNDYYHKLGEGLKLGQAIDTVIKHIGTAIVLTSVTTAVGFLSLVTSPVSQVGEFGLFIGFGVIAALIISITWIPALLSLTDHAEDKGDNAKERESEKQGSEILANLGEFVVGHKTVILIVGILILGIAAYGTTLLTVETNTLRFFRPNSDIRKSTEVIDDSFGGSENLSIVVNGDIKDPEVLNGMLELQEQLGEIEEVGYSQSIANLITEINKALHDNDPDELRIPDTRNAVSQELLLYEMSGDSSDFEQLVNYNYDKARINIRMTSVSSSKLAEIIDRVEREAKEIAGGKFDVQVTGSSYLFKVLTDLLIKGQVISLSIALVAVAVIVGLIFLSVNFGLLSMIPLGFTIGVNFGLMGLLGIPLDNATTMLASIAIGIGVDYTIHFISRYRLELDRGESPESAVIDATRTTGQAIFFNAIAVAIGFGVLLASSFTPIATLGALVALTIALSAGSALTLLPAALLWTEKV